MASKTHIKLQSERGASLSMALMLFLVCTMVASVVITASTTASGRLSQLREAEKSYYNVTSAAKLLKDVLQNPGPVTVTIKRRCEVTKDDDGKWVVDEHTCTASMTNPDLSEIDLTSTGLSVGAYNSVFQLASCDLLFYGLNNYGNHDELKDTRTVATTTIADSIDCSSGAPVSKPVTFTQSSYNDGFELTSYDSDGNQNTAVQPVHVTVTRNDDETFSFTFTEAVSSSNPTPSIYTVVVYVNAVSRDSMTNPDGPSSVFESTTEITWTYLYTIAGGA